MGAAAPRSAHFLEPRPWASLCFRRRIFKFCRKQVGVFFCIAKLFNSEKTVGLQSGCLKKTEVSRKLGSVFVMANRSTFISVIALMAERTTFSSQCSCVGCKDAVSL